MQVPRPLQLVDNYKGLYVNMRWRELPVPEDTQKPLRQAYANAPNPLLKHLEYKNIPQKLVTKACCALGRLDGGVQHAI